VSNCCFNLSRGWACRGRAWVSLRTILWNHFGLLSAPVIVSLTNFAWESVSVPLQVQLEQDTLNLMILSRMPEGLEYQIWCGCYRCLRRKIYRWWYSYIILFTFPQNVAKHCWCPVLFTVYLPTLSRKGRAVTAILLPYPSSIVTITNAQLYKDVENDSLLVLISHTNTRVFTHVDFRRDSIMIKNDHVTGIIDWEVSGWYPEHWEFVKAFYICDWATGGMIGGLDYLWQ
jgi:hypothetical protein